MGSDSSLLPTAQTKMFDPDEDRLINATRSVIPARAELLSLYFVKLNGGLSEELSKSGGYSRKAEDDLVIWIAGCFIGRGRRTFDLFVLTVAL